MAEAKLVSIKKPGDDYMLRKSVLESLLYFSIIGEHTKFPTPKNFIYNEVVRGLVSFVTGEESTFDNPEFERLRADGTRECTTHPVYEGNLWVYLTNELARGERKLRPETREVMIALLRPNMHNAQTGDKEFRPELYVHYRRFPINPSRSTWDCTTPWREYLKSEVVPSLPAEVRDDVREIGMMMRKYIQQDLEHIRKKFLW